LLDWKLEIAIAQSEAKDARSSVPEDEDPAALRQKPEPDC
jgi:hypothetical protein